jgi:hypothetical protein
MCLAPFFGKLDMDMDFHCEVKKQFVQTLGGSIVCEYAKTYVWAFPLLAGTSMLLLVAREFIQRRFYYYLLRSGGVMSFEAGSTPFRDVLIVGNVIVFSQYWLFVAFVVFCTYENLDGWKASQQIAKAIFAAAANPSLPSQRMWDKYKGDEAEPRVMRFMIDLLVMIGLPGIFLVIKLCSSYDIEQTLIPLSEFIRDTECEENAEVEDFSDSDTENMKKDPMTPAVSFTRYRIWST